MTPTFFPTPGDFRAWLEAHHSEETELWVGFYKKASGKPSMTWQEAVREALCFGWIDGIRKGIDDVSYANRFTPRRPQSNWSEINIKTVEELSRKGLMRPAGLEAFARRTEKKSGVYSYEQRKSAALDSRQIEEFRAHPKAWKNFNSMPPSYRQSVIWWVVSAKREETRARRLAKLIEDSEQGRRIGQPAPRSK